MTLLEFLSLHLALYDDFKIIQTPFRFELIIFLVSTELSENLQLSILSLTSKKEISVCLRDKSVFGSDSYVLNRFSTSSTFENENMTSNCHFDKFCELIKKYENLQTK